MLIYIWFELPEPLKSNGNRSISERRMRLHDRGNSKSILAASKTACASHTLEHAPAGITLLDRSAKGAKKQVHTEGQRLEDMHITFVFPLATCGAIWITHHGELQSATAEASELALDLYTRYEKRCCFFVLSSRPAFFPSPISTEEAYS